jgi:hypothetical protein
VLTTSARGSDGGSAVEAESFGGTGLPGTKAGMATAATVLTFDAGRVIGPARLM